MSKEISYGDVVETKDGNVYKIEKGDWTEAKPLSMVLIKQVGYVNNSGYRIDHARMNELVVSLGLKKIGRVVVTETIEYL